MKNYICLNGVKTELTSEQVAEVRKTLGGFQIKLADISVGETFKLGTYNFIVLEHSKETTAVILKNLLHKNEQFGSKNNNYNGSHVDELCNEFVREMEAVIGENNIVEHTVDLTSDDGLKTYGKIRRKSALLTVNQYRRYVEILDKHKIDSWWWLATAWSTPEHGYESTIKCVSPSGLIDYGRYHIDYGVRPFCILKSDIFVS